MFKTKMMQNVSDILGMVGCGSSKEMKELVTKRVPAGICAGYLSPLWGLLNLLAIFPTAALLRRFAASRWCIPHLERGPEARLNPAGR
jgi:hypothetical protein